VAAVYTRVSSANDRQSTQWQIEDLTWFANGNDFTIVNIYEEYISGAAKNENRTVLMECLSFCGDNKIDCLLLSELSRLGHSTLQVSKSISRTSVYTLYSPMMGLIQSRVS